MWDDTHALVEVKTREYYTLTVKRVTKPEQRTNLSYSVYIEKTNNSLKLFDSSLMEFTLGKEYTWTFTPEQGGDCHLWIVNNVRTPNLHTTQFQVTLSKRESPRNASNQKNI